nr:hypothetical protein SHINE37_40519 [Rhizobiaceae bacterium]
MSVRRCFSRSSPWRRGLPSRGQCSRAVRCEGAPDILAGLGARLGGLRGADGDLRQDRHRRGQFRLRDLRAHRRHPPGARPHADARRQLAGAGKRAREKLDLPRPVGPCDRRLVAVLLPRAADRQGRPGRAGRQALRRAGRRLRRPVPRRAAFAGPLAGRSDDRRRRLAAGAAYMRETFFNAL